MISQNYVNNETYLCFTSAAESHSYSWQHLFRSKWPNHLARFDVEPKNEMHPDLLSDTNTLNAGSFPPHGPAEKSEDM